MESSRTWWADSDRLEDMSRVCAFLSFCIWYHLVKMEVSLVIGCGTFSYRRSSVNTTRINNKTELKKYNIFAELTKFSYYDGCDITTKNSFRKANVCGCWMYTGVRWWIHWNLNCRLVKNFTTQNSCLALISEKPNDNVDYWFISNIM